MSEPVFGFLGATIVFTTPILLVALGEIIAERSGVFNLGVEGIMIVGALIGVVGTGVFGNPWFGLVTAMVVGVVIALVHAFLTVSLKSDQIISGLMITILAGGVTTFVDVSYELPNIDGFETLDIPVLTAIPIVGDILGRIHAPDVVALLLVPLVWLLFKTDFGLRIIAVGDNPAAADSMGISVRNMRYFCVLLGGALAALGGAVLSVASVGFFGAGLTGGRGFVAIGVVIFAAWRPWYALVGAVLFGALDAAGTRGELIRGFIGWVPLPGELTELLFAMTHPALMNMYPYVVTIIALVVISYWGSENETAHPQAIMQPFFRESQ